MRRDDISICVILGRIARRRSTSRSFHLSRWAGRPYSPPAMSLAAARLLFSGGVAGASIVGESHDVGAVATRPRRLLDQVRATLRLRHYSRRTERAYVGWIR